MDQIRHFLRLETAIDQLARLILGHGRPFLEVHGMYLTAAG